MASLFIIRLNYSRGMEQARKLGDLADSLKEEVDRHLEDTIADLNENWNGENAQAYLMKCRKLQDNIRKNVNQLRKASETVRTLVQNTYNAEMNSYRIAQKRTYH